MSSSLEVKWSKSTTDSIWLRSVAFCILLQQTNLTLLNNWHQLRENVSSRVWFVVRAEVFCWLTVCSYSPMLLDELYLRFQVSQEALRSWKSNTKNFDYVHIWLPSFFENICISDLSWDFCSIRNILTKIHYLLIFTFGLKKIQW